MLEKFLWYPVSPFIITQGFGDDKACVSTLDNKTVVSKQTTATCPPNFRSLYTQTKGHNGLDLVAKKWQPVYAAHDGIVNEVQTEVERGLGVGIVTAKRYLCKESGQKEFFKTRYWHFIALDVHLGDKVKVGQFIGYADSTGFSTGDHCHFELKPVLIRGYENAIPYTDNVLPNNGMLGSIDPAPYFNQGSALQIAGIIRQIAELSARLADALADKLRNK